MKIPVVSVPRHIHLSKEDFQTLFGEQIDDIENQMSHRGQVLVKSSVSISSDTAELGNTRIIGPEREKTQIEISLSEAHALGINPPVRLSGDAGHAAALSIKGPKGEVRTNRVIIPARHLHCSDQVADTLGLSHGQHIQCKIEGRETTIDQIVVRIHPTFATELHIMADEAAHFWIESRTYAQIV